MHWDEMARAMYCGGAAVHRSILIGDTDIRAALLVRVERRRLFGNSAINCYCFDPSEPLRHRVRAVQSCIAGRQPFGPATPIVLFCAPEAQLIPPIAPIIEAVHSSPETVIPSAGALIGALDTTVLRVEVEPVGSDSQRLTFARHDVEQLIAGIAPPVTHSDGGKRAG